MANFQHVFHRHIIKKFEYVYVNTLKKIFLLVASFFFHLFICTNMGCVLKFETALLMHSLVLRDVDFIHKLFK